MLRLRATTNTRHFPTENHLPDLETIWCTDVEVCKRQEAAMIDHEVQRLRRLRAAALQLRAVARALRHSKWTRDDSLLNQGSCAAWRVARTVSGHLRAHPHARYQKDAGVSSLVRHSVIAAIASLTASSRRRTMMEYEVQLKAMMRELDDARALTRAADLSDTFGRSQREIRALIDAVRRETHGCGAHEAPRRTRQAVSAEADSPFLTI